MKKICLNNRDEMIMLFVDNIAYIMADGNYTKICYIGGMTTVLSFAFLRWKLWYRLRMQMEKSVLL